MDTSAFISALQTTLGTTHVFLGSDPMAQAYLQDWRKRYQGHALAVVRPANTQEVAEVVQLCAAYGVAVVPQGGNTGLCGGATPLSDRPSIVISLQRMHHVRKIDAANQTITADAGCVLQAMQQAAADAGWLYPLSMGSEGSCTLGGNLGTNAGGTQVLRYGNTRDLCLGLEVVTAQGSIVSQLHGLRKDNTGYDLRHLFIGSEGTLGIITAATMKLFPQPAVQLAAWVAIPNLESALALLQLAQQHAHAQLTGFEVMGQFALSLVDKHFPQLKVPLYQDTPYCVLLELSDYESQAHATATFERLLEAALEQSMITDAVVASSAAQAKNLWHIRESISLAQAEEGLNIKHDISLPISAIPAFVHSTNTQLEQRIKGVRIVNFGHLGDGNLHYNIQAPEGHNAAEFLQNMESTINHIVFDAVVLHGGSISAEHGIGQLKRDTLPRYKDAAALALMQSIKQALDPQGLMNPGKVLATQ